MERIAIIEWVDSSLQNGQVDKSEFPELVFVRSVGFIVEDTDTYMVVARDGMGKGDFRGLCAIPKICIQRSNYIEENTTDG